MSEEWRKMRWVGIASSGEIFQGPDGRMVTVPVPKGMTMNSAQRAAHRDWKDSNRG